MNNLNDLNKFYWNLRAKYPQHKDELHSLFELAYDEINEGGSEWHEVQLAYNSMNEIINDNDVKI